MSPIVPVILCGGSGTRLWPRSRTHRPKPYIPLIGETTLYQSTLKRCAEPEIFSTPIVVVGEKHLEFAQPQAASISPGARFIVEPVGRNTAPAVALAALAANPDDILLVCPSDHHIVDVDAFRAASVAAADLAANEWLVSFGITATSPEIGYGYIRRGASLSPGYRVERFVEKPDLETALSFLADGNYAWNGGIFAYRAGTFLTELEKYRPEMAQGVKSAWNDAQRAGQCTRPHPDHFAAIRGESVDYAVMENTARAAMVDANMGWSDIGNWDSLMQQREANAAGNVIHGRGEIIDATGTMIDSDGPYVTVVGADNIVVVVDGDDILVTARDAVQQVGQASRCRSQ